MKLKDILGEKVKGADGKACWKGYRYTGTEDGKDKCVKVSESDELTEDSYKVAGRPVTLNKGKKSDGTDWTVTLKNGKTVPLSSVLALIKPFPKGIKETVVYRNEELRLEITEHSEPIIFQEAEYQGRKVKLGKPMQGDVKKFKVYVKDPKTGNVKKVNFGHKGKGGEKTMRIRKNNPKARKSFRARHNCDNPGPRTKARYWSCRKW